MDMELFLLILRNTLIFIAGIYLLAVIFDVIFVVSFSSILSHHDHDLFLILTNKKDNLDRLATLLSKHGVKLDKKMVGALDEFDLKTIEHQDGEEAKKARDLLTSISEYLFLTARENKNVSNSEEFLELSTDIDEIERVYRQHALMYNADVLGYNFWISFVPTKFIYLILKRKKKETI